MTGQVKQLIHWLESGDLFMILGYVGSGMLALQLVLGLFGFAEGDDFEWVSAQAWGGFLMMFGFVGASILGEGLGWACLGGVSAGMGAAWVVRMVMKGAKKFESRGSSCKIEEVIGKEAVVYQRIPKGGVGKITVRFPHMMCEIDAVSEEEISSFKRVVIVGKRDDATAFVKE